LLARCDNTLSKAERKLGRAAMAKKSKDARNYVKMQSSESAHCYYLQKNRNNSKERMQLKKYDPIVRKHVMYKEGKM
jgi:large subunit ribosomal protein L33